MHSTEAATLDRKFGGADLSRRAVEGFAVPRTSPENAEPNHPYSDTQVLIHAGPMKSTGNFPCSANIGQLWLIQAQHAVAGLAGAKVG